MEENKKKIIEIFSDGAYSPARKQTGIGLIILKNRKEIIRTSKMYKGGTNNKGEIVGVLVGLKCIKNPVDSIIIYTDSMYVIGCATLNWERKKNIIMWKFFDMEFERVSQLCPDIQFKHVKGHTGNTDFESKYQDICDKLAVKASQEI